MGSFIILNGFDRSGTSAISRTLASHSKAELIMQPFNSGFLRKRMYDEFGIENYEEVEQAKIFFNDLRENKLNNDLINSHWYYKESSTLEYIPKKLHIIKTTINHLAQKWMKDNYSDIDVWGIWRDPKEIVSSIMNNGFYGKWYNEGINSIRKTVESVDFLNQYYMHFFERLDTDVKRTSFLLAVRTHFFLNFLDEDKLIDYAIFKNDADHGLERFVNYYNLNNYNFNEYSKKDLNLIGRHFLNREKFSFSRNDHKFMNEIFEHINRFKRNKFNL